MPKKKQMNAFAMYMQSIMPDLRREGRVFPNGMADVVPIAHPRWKALPDEEKQRFENMAKEYKKKMKGAEGDKFRQDNVGNIIAYRKDPVEEMRRRKEKERKEVVKHWPVGEDLIHEKFYLISFEKLCETEEGVFLPCELGITEYSMRDGITKSLHKFIDPGPIPLGYRFTCQSHSDETHQIPVSGFKQASNNYLGIWVELENFVNPNGELPHYPPIFCLESQVRLVEYSMDWLHGNSCLGYANRLHKIFLFENILPEFYNHVDVRAPSAGQCANLLSTTVFDYEADTRCPWHEDKEVKYCALATVKKAWYAVSDALSNIYNFQLKDGHMPSNNDPLPITIISPNAISMEPRMPRGRNQQSSAYEKLVRGKGNDSYTSRDNGPYASRDYRYQKNDDEDEENQDHSDQEQTATYKQTLRRPNMPDYEAPRAPWASAAPPGGQKSGTEEWPTLGGGKSTGVGQHGKTLAEAVRGNQRNQGKTVIRDERPVQKPTIHEAVKYAGKQVAPSADQAPAPPAEWQYQVKQSPAARQALAVQQMQRRHLEAQKTTTPAAAHVDSESESNWDPQGAAPVPQNRPAPSAWSGQLASAPAPTNTQPSVRQRVPNAWAGSAQVKAATAMQMTRAPTANKANPWNQPPPSHTSQTSAPRSAWNQPPPTRTAQPGTPTASAWTRPPQAVLPAGAWTNPQAPESGQAPGLGRGRGRGLYNPNSGAPMRPPPGIGQPSGQGLSNPMSAMNLGNQ